MSNESVEAIIREYLPQISHLSLATSHTNTPWVCEVRFAYDDGLNLYFISSPNARHSQEMAKNPRVAGNIITQHFNNQKVRGVYFEGTAKEWVDEAGLKAYRERFPASTDLLKDIPSTSTSLYKVTVQKFYVFDQYESDGTKYELTWGDV